MYSIFISLHSHWSGFESGLITLSYVGKKKWIFIFTVLDLCAFLFCAKLQSLLHSSVFIQFIVIDQCVYDIFLLSRFLF